MCPGGNQRVTSDQNVCVLGGFMLFVQGGLSDKGIKDMSRGGTLNLSRGQIYNQSCPGGGYNILSRGCCSNMSCPGWLYL